MAREPFEWGYIETYLYEDMGTGLGMDFQNDRMAQALYDTAYFNFDISQSDRKAVREAFDGYMRDTYGIEVDDVFDWDNYRNAYDNAAV